VSCSNTRKNCGNGRYVDLGQYGVPREDLTGKVPVGLDEALELGEHVVKLRSAQFVEGALDGWVNDNACEGGRERGLNQKTE